MLSVVAVTFWSDVVWLGLAQSALNPNGTATTANMTSRALPANRQECLR